MEIERTESFLEDYVSGDPLRKIYKRKEEENDMARAGRTFFTRRADNVAQGLLGRVISVKQPNGNVLSAVVSEVGAYEGSTQRTSEGAKFNPGTVSISSKMGQYLIDIATGAQGKKDASCVTIRALDIESQRVQGPGNVSKYLGLTSSTVDIYEGETAWGPRVWIAGQSVAKGRVVWKKGNSDNCMGFYSFTRVSDQ